MKPDMPMGVGLPKVLRSSPRRQDISCGRSHAQTGVRLTFHFLLRGKVELLEEVWGDGDGACSPDLPQSIIAAVVLVEILVVAVRGHSFSIACSHFVLLFCLMAVSGQVLEE